MGVTVMVVGMAELYRLALPFQDPVSFWGPLSTPSVDGPRLLTALYHIAALSVAWAYGLIRHDGHRLPPRLVVFGGAVTILPMLAYPTLMVVPWEASVAPDWRPAGRYLDAIMRVLTGLAAAVVFARGLARRFCPTADPKLNPLGGGTQRLIDLVAIVAVPGVVLGWQSLPAVLFLASILARMLERFEAISGDAFGRFSVALPLAIALQLACWRSLQASPLWPGVGSEPYLILAAAALALMIPIWLRDSNPPGVGTPPDERTRKEDLPR